MGREETQKRGVEKDAKRSEKLKRSTSGNRCEQKLGSKVDILKDHFMAYGALCLFQDFFFSLHIFSILPLNPF